jgi:hypothetical protein
MKTITRSLLVGGVTVLAVTTAFAARQGTEVIHYSVRVAMTNDGVEPGASGSVQATEAIAGNADQQTLSVTAKGLTPGTGYSLLATSNGTPTDLDDFTTDSKGRATLSFSTSGHGKKNLGSPPTPVTLVSEVDIVNNSSNSQAVLTADLINPASLKYSVKKSATTTNGVSGTINLTSSNKGAKLGLTASGLSPGADYILTFTGNPVQTNTASAKGDLKLSTAGTTTNMNILDLNEVDLEDTNSVTVWSISIP